MAEQFIGESIQPVPGSFDNACMARGIPGVPREFFWRKKQYLTAAVISTWRSTGPCHHGSAEQYVRRHWFKIKTDSGDIMTIYFDKGTHGKRKEMGWHLFTVTS